MTNSDEPQEVILYPCDLLSFCKKKKKKSKCEPRPFVIMGTSEGRKMEGHHHEENNYTALV